MNVIPGVKGFVSIPLSTRFWSHVDKSGGPTACWPWLAVKDRTGYGQAKAWNRTVRAHRVAYILTHGWIRPGLTIDHFRLNPGPRHAPCSKACVNPAHLEAVSKKENTLRGVGVSAWNARKTCCPRGHVYDCVQNDGDRTSRGCRVCRRRTVQRASARYYARHLKVSRG